MSFKAVAKGIATYVPGLLSLAHRSTGGTVSARYCYSVWLRHLCMAHDSGLNTNPETVAELGPGDSLGIGLAALLSGVKWYHAFDVEDYTNRDRNLAILHELVDLFRSRARIPDQVELPLVSPRLQSYEFPTHILGETRLSNALQPARIEAIERVLEGGGTGSHSGSDVGLCYSVPWNDDTVLQPASVDVVYSQAVLEHVDDLPGTYQALYKWLKPGGWMSHQIDFSCHGYANAWNGHWGYSDIVWKLVRGRRTFLLNREPCATHMDLIRECGFRIVHHVRREGQGGIGRRKLASRFRGMSDEDLGTRSVFILAIKS